MHSADDPGIERTLIRARSRCGRRGAQLTEQRVAVLKLLLRQRRPLTAYDLRAELGRLQHRAVSPITIYRALGFLVREGLVAHLARHNAYIACEHVERDHAHLIFVCTICGSTTELAEPAIERRIAYVASRLGFVPAPMTIEIDGTCRDCSRAGNRCVVRA